MGPIVAADSVPRPGHVTRVALILALGAGIAAAARASAHDDPPRRSQHRLVEAPSPLLRSHHCGSHQDRGRKYVHRAIDRHVANDSAAIDRCFRKARSADNVSLDDLHPVTVVMSLSGGTAQTQRIEGASSTLETCLSNIVDGWTFRPRAHGTYSFHIAPPIDLAPTVDHSLAPTAIDRKLDLR